MAWREAYRARKDAKEIEGLSLRAKTVVFYAEDPGAWDHYESVVHGLTVAYNRPICYLTSDPLDPILFRTPVKVGAFYIGTGKIRRRVLESLDAKVLVSTRMSDEARELVQASSGVHHRVYLQHSILSCHMAYCADYFDGFDTVLCAGPHHMAELKALAEDRHRKAPQLVPLGSGKIDTMIARRRVKPDTAPLQSRHVLIAPGLLEEGLLSRGEELVSLLLSAGFKITLRPHPAQSLEDRKTTKRLERLYGDHPGFWIEEDLRGFDCLLHADALISDWSSLVFDYALGSERPVLSLDYPRRIRNPEYGRLTRHPVETVYRSRLGAVVRPDNLREVPARLEELCREIPERAKAMRELRGELLFNEGMSGSIGATAIESIAVGINPQETLQSALESIKKGDKNPFELGG